MTAYEVRATVKEIAKMRGANRTMERELPPFIITSEYDLYLADEEHARNAARLIIDPFNLYFGVFIKVKEL